MKKYAAFINELDGQKVFDRVVKLARDHKFYVEQKLVINAMLEEGITPNPYQKGVVDANLTKIEEELRFLFSFFNSEEAEQLVKEELEIKWMADRKFQENKTANSETSE